MNFINTQKSTNLCIIISTLQIIQVNLFIVVVTTIAEGVDGCDTNRILRNSTYAPRVIGVSRYCLSILIYNGDYVALQVFDEVIGNVVEENTTNAILIIIERNKGIAIPGLTKDLCSVESIGMKNTVNLLACSDAVCVVGISIAVKALELSAFLPSQSMTEIRDRSSPNFENLILCMVVFCERNS